MVNIFDYTDFLKYLSDIFAERKAAEPGFCYEYLKKRGGFNNKGFVYNIFHGKKAVSRQNARRLSRALGHSAKEADYFENLTAFCQTTDLARKNGYFKEMCRLHAWGGGYTEAQRLRKNQFEYYSRVHLSALRSLIGIHSFKDAEKDFRMIGRMLRPRISLAKVRKSIRLLKKLGLVETDKNGHLAITRKSITSGPGNETSSLALRNFHFDCTGLAKQAISDLDRKYRNITGLTLGVSRDGYGLICNEIALFQNRIMEIANDDRKADRVYQLNFHFFPLSGSTDYRKTFP